MDNFDFVEAFSNNEDSTGKSVAATTLKDSSVKTCFVCIPQLLIHVAKDTIEPIADACKEAGVVRIIKVGSASTVESTSKPNSTSMTKA
jgi:hypothetical protein